MHRRGRHAGSAPLRALAAALALAVLGVGCASRVAVSTSFNPLKRFPARADYVWDHEASTVPGDRRFLELGLVDRVVEVTEEAMAARGWSSAAEAAEYRLVYQITVLNIVGGDYTRSVGTLWLGLHETETGDRVWSGAVRGNLYVGLNEEEGRRRLRRALDRLLAEFPPAQRG